VKLTDVTISSLRPPQKGQAEYRDDTLPNFMLRVSRGGTKVFYVIVRRRRVKIGPCPLISLAKARKKIYGERTRTDTGELARSTGHS
jgi:hypothetical protein